DELLARLLGEMAAHADDAGIMLVEHLVALEPRPYAGEDFAILLEHRPVPRLEIGAVEEAPDVALPAADLADAPEERRHAIFIDRRGEADDAEVAARPARGRIRNLEPHIERAVVDELAPVEVDVALSVLLEEEAVRRLARHEARGGVALIHGMRVG